MGKNYNSSRLVNGLSVDASGNVGVGTTPSYKLDVNGTGRFSETITGTSAVFSSTLSAVNAIEAKGTNNPWFLLTQTGLTNASARNWKLVNNWEGWGTLDFQVSADNNSAPSITRLSIDRNGAATFSSSVTAGGNITASYAGPSRLVAESTTNGNNAGAYFTARNTSGTALSGGIYYIPASTPYLTLSGDNFGSHLNITSSGLVGIGTTPSAWNTVTFPIVLQVGNASLHTNGGTFAQLMNNAYFDGTTYRYIGTGGIGRMFFDTDGAIGWGNAASGSAGAAASFNERMRITSGGNVGIGTSSPSTLVHAKTTGDGYNMLTIEATGGDAGIAIKGGSGGSSVGGWTIQSQNAGSLIFVDRNSTPAERMRITSGGVVLINKTSADAVSGAGSLQVGKEIFSLGSSAFLGFEDRNNGTYKYGWYATGNTTVYFYSSVNGNLATINPSSGTYTALSDINKKKDFEDSTIGLNAILGLKPTLYRMKDEDESIEKHLGFIAQEVKEFIPQAYVESGNEEDKFIGLTDRPIIAALVKAIQELKAENDELRSILTRNNLQ